MKKLGDNCTWTLTWNGKVEENLDDQGLDSRLLEVSKKYKIENAVLKSRTALDIAEEKIDLIKSDVKSSTIVRPKFKDVSTIGNSSDEDIEEVEYYSIIPDSIGITKALGMLTVNGGNVLVTPMNIADWRATKVKELKTNSDATDPTGKIKLTDFMEQHNITAEQVVSMEEHSWEKLTDIGTEVHSIFEAIFNNQPPTQGTLPKDIFDSVVSQITSFKESLQEKYGKDCKFYPELAIKSKNLSQDMQTALANLGKTSVNGIIDLLVIDSKGNGHIYDYKVSRKNIEKEGDSVEKWWDITGNKDIHDYKLWPSTKKLSAEYQTEFYRQMLKQYGIKVVDTNILPVKLDLQYNNPKNPFEVTGIEGIKVNVDKKVVNPGRRSRSGVSNSAEKVARLFEATPIMSSQDIDGLSAAYNTFFPANSILAAKEDLKTKVEWYKKQDKYVHKLVPGDYYYGKEGKEYRVKFRGYKTIYCTKDELDARIQECINGQSEIQATKRLDIAEAIESIKSGEAAIESLLGLVGRNQQSFVQNIFKHYLSDDWTFDYDEAMNSVGILKFRKGSKCEIVCLSNEALRMQVSDSDFNVKNKNWKGSSILGKTKSDMYVDQRKTLPALAGNLEMMKAMIYISMHPEAFRDVKIAEIKAVNPWIGIELGAFNSELIYSFNELVKENPNCGVGKVDESVFLNDPEALVECAIEHVNSLSDIVYNGGEDVNGDYYTKQWFIDVIKKYTDNHKSDFDPTGTYQDTDVWNAYIKLKEGLNAVQGIRRHIESDKDDYVQSGRYFELSGLMISSPQYSSSSNIRELAQVIDEYAKEVRKQVFTIGAPIQQCFKEVYEKYGTGSKVFDSWFADYKTLKLKDPNSPEFDGDPVTRKALDTFLKTLAILRHPDKKLDINNDSDFELIKEEDDYYYIPLLEAKASRQIKNLGIFKAIKNKAKQYMTLTEGLFMGEEPDENSISGYVSSHQELYNKFKYDNLEARQDRLNNNGGADFFETDLELVINAALVAFCRSNVSKDYIPTISGLKLALDYADAKGSSEKTKNMANIRKRFDQIVKSKFYGESIVPEGARGLLKWINMVKAGFTTLTLSLNTRSFLRESLQGIYTGISRAGVKMYPGINEKSYIEGLTYVIQEAHKNFSGVSMLQQLNAIYGMANQSLNQLAGQRRVKWAHINHWGKDTLFITATAPDFMHRMSLLVAKMKNEGCFDAHTLDENGILKYDIKKDKRFTHLVNKETSHKDYIKELSLYQAMVDDFNKAGFKKEDGSEFDRNDLDNLYLPQAYTRMEGQSIKNYADLLYGHYDDESKSLLYDTFLGSIFLQYKTYLTSKLEQWTMHSGKYNVAELRQQFDENGNALYLKFYEDENHEAHKDIILESEYNQLDDAEKQKCRVYYDYDALPMQGMLQASAKVYKSLLTLDQEKLNELWKDPTTRAMFKLQLHDLWLMAFLTFLVNMIFGSAEDVDDPTNYAKVYQAVKKTGPVENLAYNVITGSMADSQLFNIVSSFTDRPPVVSAVTRFATTSWQMICGDASAAYWLTQNIGAIRDFQGVVNNIEKASE